MAWEPATFLQLCVKLLPHLGCWSYKLLAEGVGESPTNKIPD